MSYYRILRDNIKVTNGEEMFEYMEHGDEMLDQLMAEDMGLDDVEEE